MEHQISQSFKVQWLNTTLKFIKDDSQLLKNYPQMPSSHVEYLHNLIWQRKNDVGLGFKSLYSPVWEAMKIYSVKYQFKILVEKSEDGMTGHLIMEKIPKTGEPAKEQIYEKNDKKNSFENKERDNETVYSQNNEVKKESQIEAVKHKQQEPKKSKTKTPNMSRGLKMFLENQKMLDSLSPLFIKTTLKSILDFITDEMFASKIFSNLAPMESRFLENFLSISQRRNDLKDMLSPACNELLSEISNCFDNISKTCRLEVTIVEINASTNKREVKLTKVPVFPTKKKKKQNALPKTINKTKEEISGTIDKSYIKVEKKSPKKKIIQDTSQTSQIPGSPKIKIIQDTSQVSQVPGSPKMKIIQDTFKPSQVSVNLKTKIIQDISQISQVPVSLKTKIIQDTSETSQDPVNPNKKIIQGTSQTSQVPVNPNKKIIQDTSYPSQVPVNTNNKIIQDTSHPSQVPVNPNKKIIQDTSHPSQVPVNTNNKIIQDTSHPSQVPVNTNNKIIQDTSHPSQVPVNPNKKIIQDTSHPSQVPVNPNKKIIQDTSHPSQIPINLNKKIIQDTSHPSQVPVNANKKIIQDTSQTSEVPGSPKKNIIQDISRPSTSHKALSLLQPKKKICFTKEGTSNTADVPHIKGEQKKPKMKILQDMSVPLTSDKGLRMMQLMGWKGGALGLRGEGITEPIIPIANFNGGGLGHVSNKKDSHKENKKNNRSEFLNKILEMIDNDIDVSVITFPNKLIRREIRFWNLTLKLLNERMILDLEFDKRFEVNDKMIKNPDITFKMDFEDENKKIIIKKISNTSVDTKEETKPDEFDIDLRTKARIKTFVLKSILDLIKSEDNEKIIQFNANLKSKQLKHFNTIILLINERQRVMQKKNVHVADLSLKILDAIGDLQLSVSINEIKKYVVIRKVQPKSIINKNNNKTDVNKAECAEDVKSAFDNVRSYLPIKKKHKILDALYKYEMDDTEEFKENQWYNTVDKSLLDSKTKLNINNDERKIINKNEKSEIKIENNKNNTRKVECHPNNNGGISIKVNLNNS